MRRVTAREFQKRFQRLDEPVLVGEGIWFPEATAELMAIAEGGTMGPLIPVVKDAPSRPLIRKELVEAIAKTTVGRSTAKRPLPDFSKEAQVKGKMRR